MIKLYTLPTCGICKMIKTKLTAKQIPFEEYNLGDYTEVLNTDRAPVLQVDEHNLLLTPTEINDWIKNQN